MECAQVEWSQPVSRPVTVQVGPLVSATASKIGLSQKAAISGVNYLVLNGANGAFAASSVCASQTPSGAGALLINGTLVSGGIAKLPPASRIYVTGGSDESGDTYTVVGYRFTAGGGPYAVTEVITGPNASTVSSINTYDQIVSITTSGAASGAITVGHYNTATNDVARIVLFTSAGNDSSVVATITGTDWANTPITETVTLSNGSTAVSLLSYKTVVSISTNAAIATTIQVGTNGVASSPWVRFDDYAANAQVAIAAVVSGTVNYDIEQTLDDPNDISSALYRNPAGMTWVNHPDAAVVAATATAQANYAYPPIFARVVLNSGTGTVTTTFRQVGTFQ